MSGLNGLSFQTILPFIKLQPQSSVYEPHDRLQGLVYPQSWIILSNWQQNLFSYTLSLRKTVTSTGRSINFKIKSVFYSLTVNNSLLETLKCIQLGRQRASWVQSREERRSFKESVFAHRILLNFKKITQIATL